MKEHHIWCNFLHREVSGCKLCERLNRLYPMDECGNADELLDKHFPDVIRRDKRGL